MGTWHPPIPADAVYRDEVDTLGSGLRLLWYCYNCLERDGTLILSLTVASEALGKKYETVRNWWQLLKKTGIVSVLEDRGHSGYLLRMCDAWIDWHVLDNNYTSAQRAILPAKEPLSAPERSFNGSSTVPQRSILPAEHNVYGTHDSDQAPPPTATETASTGAQAARGGGGGFDREIARLFSSYNIKQAEPLARLYGDAFPDVTLEQLRELCARLYDPSAGDYAGSRLYRLLKNGPPELPTSSTPTALTPETYAPPPRLPAPADPDRMRRLLAGKEIRVDT